MQKKWDNHKNDTLGLLEHVKWGGDIFVTSDKGILKKRDKLATIVPGKIWDPKTTLEELSKMSLHLHPERGWKLRLSIAQCWGCSLVHQEAS